MVNRDNAYLQEVLEHIVILEGFLCDVRQEDFLNHVEKQFAVARAFETQRN